MRIKVHSALALFSFFLLNFIPLDGSQQIETSKTGKSVRDLIQDLRNENELERTKAAAALFQMGPAAKEAIPALTAEMKRPEKNLARTSAAIALIAIDPETKKTVYPAMIEALKGQSVFDAFLISSFFAATSKDSIPYLLAARKHENSRIRKYVVMSLGKMHDRPEAKKIIPALIDALMDPESTVRVDAAFALETFGAAAKDAVPALILRLKDMSPAVRYGAARALEKIDPDAAAKAGIP